VHTLIHFNANTIKPVFTLRTLALTSVFFVTLVSTIYTINLKQAFVEWELAIPILVFPLLFCCNPLDLKKYRGKLLLIFALACTATIVYLYIDALITIWHYHLPLQAIISPAFTNHNFSEPIDIHATFFSLQVAVALVYLLSVLISEKLTLNSKLLYGFCCLILAAAIIQLSSKSVFATLFLVINIAIPYFLLQGSRRRLCVDRYF
jgi:O-antigen ligase